MWVKRHRFRPEKQAGGGKFKQAPRLRVYIKGKRRGLKKRVRSLQLCNTLRGGPKEVLLNHFPKG